MKTPRNVILTGIPRSGTTLTCHLLNRLPDTVALHEPMNVSTLARMPTRKAMLAAIEQFSTTTRNTIQTSGRARSKHVNGKIPDNHITDDYTASGRRARAALFAEGEIAIDKALSSDFTLAIKHPAAFTAILEALVTRFPTYAVIRNPLAVLASWNSVSMAVANGHAPAAENLDCELATALAGCDDKTDRQFYLLSWFYEQYQRFLPQDSIIRYEDLVASHGRLLQVISSHAQVLDVRLTNKNRNAVYDARLMRQLGERLLASDGVYWAFYKRDSVEAIMAERR